MKDFNTLLETSAKIHGHLCPGQVIGVRMSMLGCRLLGIEDPLDHAHKKKLIVYVEMDRCTADAVSYVTGTKLGRRTLKFADYGIMAATFINLESSKACRVISTEDSREQVSRYASDCENTSIRQLTAYKRMPDSVLFRVQEVTVRLGEYDLPGPTRHKAICSVCGQVVRDGREVVNNGRVLCRPCTADVYFSDARDITWPDMDWVPDE